MTTFLDIAKSVAIEVGLGQPYTAQGKDPDSIKLARLINEACFELVRRVDWHILSKRQTITGDGVERTYSFEADFSRLSPGMCAKVDGIPIRGGITQDEWMSVEPVAGVPRYFFASSSAIGFHPHPQAGTIVTLNYQSAHWCQTNDGVGRDRMSADTDICLLSEPLVVRGAIWRWLRQDGRDFADYNAEFESMLKDIAASEGVMRSP